MSKELKQYSELEEILNIFTHALGFLLSAVAATLLAIKASVQGNVWHIVSFSVFGVSLMLLFAASTMYHITKAPKIRARLRVFDHAAIYILIAGTYTPYCLVTLHGAWGWTVFGINWSIAVIGIILKLFFTGRFKVLSTITYLFMGWVVVIAIKPLMHSLPAAGLLWLAASGVCYTIGAILYSIKRIHLNHAIFHIFVLLGSACSFVSVYFYVI